MTSTPPMPPDPPVRSTCTRSASLQKEGNQREVAKEQSVPVLQVETQVPPENQPQTRSQEGDMPNVVQKEGGSTVAANVPQNPTTTPPQSYKLGASKQV